MAVPVAVAEAALPANKKKVNCFAQSNKVRTVKVSDLLFLYHNNIEMRTP